MNSVRNSLLIFAFIICFVCTSISQTRPAWVSDIEIALDKGDWKTLYKRFYQMEKSKKFHSVQIQLLYKEEVSSTIDINLKTSNKEAFDALKWGFDLISSKQINAKKDSPKIGDESFMYDDPGWTNIKFRKGKVYTEVMSQSEETAKILAQILADLIPNKVK